MKPVSKRSALAQKRPPRKLKFIVTAGPTREFIDPVRFISNPSTGKMGFAIARAAAQRGHDVQLIAGPVALKTPKSVARTDIVSARDMLASVLSALDNAGTAPVVVISTAAIADWRPAECASKKLKKAQMDGVLRLVRNPDVLKTVSERIAERGMTDTVKLVGFAAETGNALPEARRKCREKGLSMIVANDVTEKGAGFGTDTNRVAFLMANGEVERLPLMSKLAVARRIIRKCEAFA